MNEHPPFPRIHVDEVAVNEELVRELLRSQFPEWAALPLRPVPSTGTDNVIYRLGDEMGIRLPRIHGAVGQIAKESAWLERLSKHVPVELPLPLAEGAAGSGYPYPWLVYRWIEGEDLQHAAVPDWNRLAEEIAAFVLALGEMDPAEGPPAGRRGGSLAPHDEIVRAFIPALEGIVDTDSALAVWRAALRADERSGPPVWVHGDLLPGNIVMRNGRLRGVIDWSAAGLGDPACEAMLAWFLPPGARDVYRRALGFDDATWTRARGWVVEQAALFIPYYADTIPDAVATATLRLQAVLDDSRGDEEP